MNIQLPNKQTTRAGMTLVEMLIAVAIGMIVMAAVATLTVFTIRSFVALGNYNDLDQASRNALDSMSREIRQCKSLTSYATNQLVFNNQNGDNLTFVWNPNTRILSRTLLGQTKVLLNQCDYLRFGMSQQNPSNDFNFYPTTSLATAKLVDVSWTCSRQILGKKVNTESVQTAKIVIRN